MEKRLSRPIPALAPDLSLPPELAARLAGSGADGVRYGRQRGAADAFAQEVTQRVQVGVSVLRGGGREELVGAWVLSAQREGRGCPAA